jgi:hypothetical protein
MMARVVMVLLAGVCTAVAADPGQRSRTGRAYDPESGLLLYEERHLETLRDGRMVSARVRYVDAEGRPFADKRVDFDRNPYIPEFELENGRTGHMEVVRRLSDAEIQVRFREAESDALREARLSVPEDALADAGFDRFVEAHWEELMSGRTLVRCFLVPSRLEFMDLQIRKSAEDGEQVRFTMEFASFLLRLLVPSIEVSYDRLSRRLLQYDGVSNLRDARGKNMRVRIEFDYGTQVAFGE